VIYVADFRLRTENERGVEIHPENPSTPDGTDAMVCLKLINDEQLHIDFSIFDDSQFKKEEDENKDDEHCECCFFRSDAGEDGWIGFIEIKDCKPNNIPTHKQKAKEQIISTVKHFRKKAQEAAELSSAAERKAVEAEREVEKLKKAEYMNHHRGEVFDGLISGVTGFGIYVQLENTVEGRVRIDDLRDDYYNFFPEKYALIGERTGKTYKLGDKVTIMVDSVDIERREINFQIEDRPQNWIRPQSEECLQDQVRPCG